MLDSTVLIDVLKGRAAGGRVRSLVADGHVLGTSPINVEEVLRGVRPGEMAEADQLFRGLRVLTIGEDEARRAAGWRREFGARGLTLHQGDCLIAATAVEHNAVLVTGNVKHFPMPELAVEHWPPGA